MAKTSSSRQHGLRLGKIAGKGNPVPETGGRRFPLQGSAFRPVATDDQPRVWDAAGRECPDQPSQILLRAQCRAGADRQLACFLGEGPFSLGSFSREACHLDSIGQINELPGRQPPLRPRDPLEIARRDDDRRAKGSDTRRSQMRRFNRLTASSGPNPSSIWTCGSRGPMRFPSAHSSAPQL